ncbi:MAG: thioredoxin family protein [bacterium]
MIIKVFWQQSCPTCPPAKRLGAELAAEGHNVEYHDIKDVEGLTQAIRYDIKATPSIVIADQKNNEIISFRSTVPTLEEIRSYLDVTD